MTTDNRRTELSHVRAMVSAMQAQCDKLRESWPDRYPVPVEVDAAFRMEDAVIAQARGNELKRTTPITLKGINGARYTFLNFVG